jgi:tellurite resistance protein TehA-like permease
MRADFRNHARAPGWFTCVAGTAVVGSGSVALGVHGALPSVLLALAAAAWLVLTYAVFAGLATAREKPALAHGIDGAWLLAVVATQSLAVLAALLSPGAAQPARLDLNFMALCGWLVGGMLYTWLMTLIVYRALFFRFEPSDLTPPWWINMGAMAISTLAGAQLVIAAPDAPMLQSMLPFLRGGTVLYWATGTWWLPLLVVLSVWRHVLRREPLRYALAQWSAVFPLGMYSVATGKLGLALDLPFAATVSTVFFWIALAAWLAAAVGWLRATVRRYAHRAA